MNTCLRLAAIVAVTAGLAGCFGLGGGHPYIPAAPGKSKAQTPAPVQPTPVTPVTPSAPLPGCSAEEVASKGDLAKDLVGTWQDWEGETYIVTTFEADGTVTIGSFPVVNGELDETSPLIIESRGTYTVNAGQVSITWDDGTTEVSTGTVETIPDCTMLFLVVPEGRTSRIPHFGELERVSCVAASAPGLVPVEK